MDKKLFDDLVCSLKEAKAISHGETQASRQFEVNPADVKTVWKNTGLTQNDAAVMGVGFRCRLTQPTPN